MDNRRYPRPPWVTLPEGAPPAAGEVRARRALFGALAGRQAEIDQFLGVMTGSVPLADYFKPRNLLRLLGVRGMAGVALRGRRPAPVG